MAKEEVPKVEREANSKKADNEESGPNVRYK